MLCLRTQPYYISHLWRGSIIQSLKAKKITTTIMKPGSFSFQALKRWNALTVMKLVLAAATWHFRCERNTSFFPFKNQASLKFSEDLMRISTFYSKVTGKYQRIRLILKFSVIVACNICSMIETPLSFLILIVIEDVKCPLPILSVSEKMGS